VAEFKVPELGENVAGGDVTSVLVKVGDTIAVDQTVLELETEKATVEVPSSVAGRVSEIRVKPGDKVNVGAVVLVVEDGAQASPKAQEDAEPKAEEAEAEEPKGQKPEKVVSMPARQAPEPSKPAPRAEGAEAQPKPQPPSPKAQSAKPEAGAPAAPAAPGVRRLAREVGVNIDEVQGTGPQGRISEQDVKEHARRILSSVGTSAPRPAAERPAAPLPDFSRWGEIDRQPMSNVRRTSSDRLSHAWITIPHVSQFDQADITAMEELRKK
jgi:pyruvate dehydrogenase E2 component (dihydrolipoamide acetyltransferase)